MSARKPVAHRITSARSSVPSGIRMPSGSMRENIGCRTSTPRACAASDHAVRCWPVTEMTLPGGSPRRTRSSTPAIAAMRAAVSNSVASHRTSCRVTQNVLATCEISSSSCTAEMPAPTITTRRPANSDAET